MATKGIDAMKKGTMKIALLGCVALACGCKTVQMKATPFYEGNDVTYTGNAEDRVNLWPLAYWREPVGSVLWPLVSFSDDQFAVRPLYSRYGTEHNFLWPIGQYDTDRESGRIFPLFWGRHYFNVFPVIWNDNDFHSLFPLVFWEKEDYLTLFPLVWWDIDGESFTLFPIYGHDRHRDWLFPLFYRDDDLTLVTPLFGMNKDGDSWLAPIYYHDEDMTWVTPLFGMNRHGDSWLIPLYASVAGDFVSPLWCRGGAGDNDGSAGDWWCAPPLLSWGGESNGVYEDRYLLGLAGRGNTDGVSRSWLMPFYYGDSDGTLVTPLYGHTKTSSWTFPVWYRDEDSFASWFWGGHWNGNDELDWWVVPPLLTMGGRGEDGSHVNILTALAGARWDGPDGYRSSWMFPLWYENSDGTLVTPLYGQTGRGESRSQWIFPIVYKDSLDLVTPLWWQSFDRQTGRTESWMIPPLLTGGGFDDDGDAYFYCPLGGFSDSVSGIFPLWYRDKAYDTFATVPYVYSREGDSTLHAVPPLLSWRRCYDNGGSSTRALLGIYGHDTASDGTASSDWLFPVYSWDAGRGGRVLLGLAGWETGGDNWLCPLYYYDRDDGDVMTLLFGRETCCRYSNYWFLTPLVGVTTGDEVGFWFQPLVHWNHDRRLPELERMMNADRLDASVKGGMEPEIAGHYDRKTHAYVRETNMVFRIDGHYDRATDSTMFLLDLAGRERRISCSDTSYWHADGAKRMAGDEWREGRERTVSFCDDVEVGNILLFRKENHRVVNFDYDTKEKVFDGEYGESGLLCNFLWSSRDEHIAGGHDYHKRAVLWRLYHREELDGDSTTDIFPFITRDTKKNGYSKTSFLWRFFRYENDPEKGTSVDFLFIPLCRP